MPSTYTALGVQKMATGEKAGTWGTLTNTNWDIIEQISGGYTTQAVTDGADTALSVSDGATGATLAHRCIQFTGSLSAGRNVTIPLDVQQIYILKNATSGSQTVTFKYTSGSGSSVAISNGSTVLVYATANDGTNPDIVDTGFGASTSPGGSNTQVQYNNSGAFGGDADLIWTAGTGLTINSQKELRLADTDDSAYIGFKAAGTTTSYTLTMPAAVASSNDQILTSTTGGVLSWVDNSGGTSWQAVKTSGFTAVGGQGYFCNTTSAAFTVALPAGSIGDEVTCVDYAGTFDSNNLTVSPNGSEKINGVAADLTVSVERAAFTLVFTDSTQGWVLKDK
jgi:hypothetical protein